MGDDEGLNVVGGVGLDVGFFVGINDVGPDTGCFDGFGVGPFVVIGRFVGNAVGMNVGNAVGFNVVGLYVSPASVGRSLGTWVGDVDGECVVGLLEGFADVG